MRASSSPTPTARISSTRRLSVPRPRKNENLPCTTTRLPSVSGGSCWRSSADEQVRLSDTSADGSRSTMNAVALPCRILIWVS